MSFFAAVVEIPRTAPSSATQNSATSGAPSPAMGSSCSQPGTEKVAASWIDSGGCRSAHRAARTSRSAAASASSRSRGERGEQVGGGEVLDPTCLRPASASLMCSILPTTTDSRPCLWTVAGHPS